MLKLLIEDDEGKQTVVPLIRDEITIGRKEGNTIRLTERNVSRRHARILKINGSVFVEDVASRYGTRLNGAKIAADAREKLGPDDEVTIGDYRLTIQDESRKAADSTQIREAAKEPEGPQPIPAREQARLVVISSNFAGQEFPIARTEMVIGRNQECDIIIDHRSISGTHAKVVRGQNKVFKIVDLKSANGIKVNGAPYAVKELLSGEMIELGHVRFRFCAPGELWSFQLAAGLVEDLSPPPSRSPMIALIAILVLLVVAVAAFFLVKEGDGEGEAGATVTSSGGPAPATAPVSVTLEDPADEEMVNSLIRECSDHADKGEFDIAVAKCKQALDLAPGNPLLVEKYDRMVVEKTLKDSYVDIKDRIAQGDCEFALIDLDGIADPSSWAARQILKENLREQVITCIVDDTRNVVGEALDEQEWDRARDKIRGLEQLDPKNAAVPQLYAMVDQAEKDDRRSDRSDRKKPRDDDPKEPKDTGEEPSGTNTGSDDGGKDCLAEAEALADEAKSIIIGNPSKAAGMLKQALKCEGKSKWRGLYAFALERQGKNCDALKEYKRAVGGLSGKEKARAQRSIDKFSAECN